MRFRFSCPSFALLFLLVASLQHQTTGEVYWDNCDSPADHPDTAIGDYFNLCIIDEEFSGRHHSWKFTKTEIRDSSFKDCVFENRPNAPSNFTEATWTNVLFDGCAFGSIDIDFGKYMTFDKTTMTNVEFRNCVFDHSVITIFQEFLMNNVSFVDCAFKGNTYFKMGTINKGLISGSMIMHSTETMTKGDNESMTFESVTINQMDTINNHFVNPIRFQGVSAADVSFNKTVFNEFHCHGDPDENGEYELLTRFNETSFGDVEFHDQVFCDQTSWRGFFCGNVSFFHNAFFSSSEITGIYWDGIKSSSKGEGNECRELNFSNSYLDRKVFANCSVDCVANFEATSFETVYVKNFYARKPNFKNAVFINQEYIDGQCCSQACSALQCKCNVSEPSGNCPVAGPAVNLTAEYTSCFPADSTLTTEAGKVITMEELAYRERIAIGGGQHSDIFFFGHRAGDVHSEFIRLKHSGSETALRISASHYLYVNGELRTAMSVRTGDRLRAADGKDVLIVEQVGRELGRGLYAPTSLHGDLLVDGVVVSSYTAAVHPGLAHKLLQPLRVLYRYGLHSLVSRFNMLEQQSWDNVARALRIPRGPAVLKL